MLLKFQSVLYNVRDTYINIFYSECLNIFVSHRAPLSRREKTRSAKIDGIDCFAQTGYRTTVDAHRLFDFDALPAFHAST